MPLEVFPIVPGHGSLYHGQGQGAIASSSWVGEPGQP